MKPCNADIATLFDELADRLQERRDNPFKIRAYRAAARFIAEHPQPMTDLLDQGQDLTRLPGIGDAIARKIEAIVETGRLRQLDELKHAGGDD